MVGATRRGPDPARRGPDCGSGGQPSARPARGSTRGSTAGSATTRSRSGSTSATASTRERMQPGHPNWMLDTDSRRTAAALGLARAAHATLALQPAPPRAAASPRAMRGECAGARAEQCAACERSPVPRGGAAARPAVVAHVASWDHTVGKGVISPHCDRLRRPEPSHGGRSRPLPRHRAGARPSSRAGRRRTCSTAGARAPTTTRSSAATGSTRRAQSCSSWGTRPRTRRTRGASSSGSSAGGPRTRPPALQLLFRPHPRDKDWRERFAAAAARRRRRAGAELHRPGRPRGAPPARRRRRRERGHDPARRARQRPTGSVRALRRGRTRR